MRVSELVPYKERRVAFGGAHLAEPLVPDLAQNIRLGVALVAKRAVELRDLPIDDRLLMPRTSGEPNVTLDPLRAPA